MALAQFPDQVTDLDDLLGIQSHAGLIQDQHLRRSQKRLCQSYSLFIALGQIFNQASPHIRDPGHAHDLFHLFLPLRLGHFFQLCREPQIFLHRHVHIQRRQLRQIADPLFCLLRLLLHVMAVNGHCALTGCQIAGDDIHCSGFSGAVGTQETVNLPFLHLEGQMIHSHMIPIPLGQIGHFNHDSTSFRHLRGCMNSSVPRLLPGLRNLYLLAYDGNVMEK